MEKTIRKEGLFSMKDSIEKGMKAGRKSIDGEKKESLAPAMAPKRRKKGGCNCGKKKMGNS
ncbi:MAG: hypothetical protein Q8934_07215 [Bacillota bacterium]|nr:hypothetical protein [Bacillota bacterium]